LKSSSDVAELLFWLMQSSSENDSSKTARPGLDKALDYAREGDIIVVWKLDRLGRSLGHLIEVVKGLSDRGIGFKSIQESLDTTTSGGRLIFHMFGAIAEFERDLIRERTNAGLEAARACLQTQVS
jgi:DNA invertase Pin-like site-specific DNA recombinase